LIGELEGDGEKWKRAVQFIQNRYWQILDFQLNIHKKQLVARIRWRKLRRSPYLLLIAAFGGQGYIPYASLATISGALQRGVGRGTGDREEWKWKTGREKDRTGQFTQNHCWQNLDFQLKMHPDPLEAPHVPYE
jgi:hypothetical protein